MPANLTPDYERAEQRYRSAATDEERLEALREMYATIPKHKGTEKLQADLKRKISQSRKTIAKKPSRGTDLFHIPRAGAGQVVLVGPPNSGKSMLVARTTHAPVKVADYPFTTSLPVPGMAHFQDVQIELVDTPPVTADHIPGGLLGTIRNSDIIAIVIDASEDPLEQAEMVVTLLESRGLALCTLPLNQLDPSDFNQHSAILIANKIDQSISEEIETLRELYSPRLELIAVSALTGQSLEAMIERIWELLSLVRVYTKHPGKPAEKVKPFTLEIGSTIEDLAREIHQELPQKMTFARIWGDGRFSGQQVHRTEVLHDRDVVEIHE
jgi:ribosome-interacting GTPase 1